MLIDGVQIGNQQSVVDNNNNDNDTSPNINNMKNKHFIPHQELTATSQINYKLFIKDFKMPNMVKIEIDNDDEITEDPDYPKNDDDYFRLLYDDYEIPGVDPTALDDLKEDFVSDATKITKKIDKMKLTDDEKAAKKLQKTKELYITKYHAEVKALSGDVNSYLNGIELPEEYATNFAVFMKIANSNMPIKKKLLILNNCGIKKWDLLINIFLYRVNMLEDPIKHAAKLAGRQTLIIIKMPINWLIKKISFW